MFFTTAGRFAPLTADGRTSGTAGGKERYEWFNAGRTADAVGADTAVQAAWGEMCCQSAPQPCNAGREQNVRYGAGIGTLYMSGSDSCTYARLADHIEDLLRAHRIDLPAVAGEVDRTGIDSNVNMARGDLHEDYLPDDLGAGARRAAQCRTPADIG
jgi:hypothetical protein